MSVSKEVHIKSLVVGVLSSFRPSDIGSNRNALKIFESRAVARIPNVFALISFLFSIIPRRQSHALANLFVASIPLSVGRTWRCHRQHAPVRRWKGDNSLVRQRGIHVGNGHGQPLGLVRPRVCRDGVLP